MFLLFFLIGLAESAQRPPWVDKIRRIENDNKLLLARIEKLEEKLDQVNTDIDDARTDIDDLQERNYAFKYYVSSWANSGAVKKGTIVNFDSRKYGSGVYDGQYSAPIGNNLIY